MSFTIEQYKSKPFPSFNRPEVVGYFSLNGKEREYSPDLSQLKYFSNNVIDKKVKFNLNEGIDLVIRKPTNLNEKIDHILRWIIDNHQKIKAHPEQKRWLRPEFVCFRGLITKICITPYEDKEGWIICAAKFHGTIYLCAFDNEEQKQKFNNMSERDLQFMSWGFKFEQFVLSDSPYILPDTSKPVNEAEEFCCLFMSKLGRNSLLYGAEMDGVDSKGVVREPVDWKNLKFVELKTNRPIKTSWKVDNYNYRKKLLKWWCQSFLVGIENIVCGNRTKAGIIFELENLKISDIPKTCKDSWNASESMNFCNSFLDHIKTVVTEDYNKCIYKFEYEVNNKIELQILPSSSEFSFLPDWYIEQSNQIIETNR